MVSDFSQHFLQVLSVIFRSFRMYFIQMLVLITWSWMAILNPVISGNNLSALSYAFDDVLINVWLFKVIYTSAMNHHHQQQNFLDLTVFLLSLQSVVWILQYLFLNLFSISAYHSTFSLPSGSKLPLFPFQKKERLP